MSIRKPRTPGTTVRKDTVRKRINEAEWRGAQVERDAYRAGILARMKDLHGDVVGQKPETGIATEIARLAWLYGDPVLRAAARRLERYGLDASDWRKVVTADRGPPYEDLCVMEAVERALAAGMTKEAAYEHAAGQFAVDALSHNAAVEAVRRTYMRWRDATPEERRPALKKSASLRRLYRKNGWPTAS